MATGTGETRYELHVIRAKLYYVLAYNYQHYAGWCRKQGIRPQGGNVRYIADENDLRGTSDYRVILLEDYYNPNRHELLQFMQFEGNPRADAVYPVPPYQPIVMEGGLIADMRLTKPPTP